MKAVQVVSAGSSPQIREVPTPEPVGRQVLVKVLAAGACHSDIAVMSQSAEALAARGTSLPLTLGHEAAGEVVALGSGAGEIALGTQVAVYGPWGCGRCHTCATGAEQYCPNAARLGIRPPGLGAPGAMADYLLVDDARHLIPLDGLNPVAAASLTDAGLTPYHAIKPVLPMLVPGSTAVVIGAGGLGHLAIQLLRALSPCVVVALDIGGDKLDFARRVGAHAAFTSDGSAIEGVRELTGGAMAEAVFDFVGAQSTCTLATGLVHSQGSITVVGLGDGAVPVSFFTLPTNVQVRAPYWGTLPELYEVLALARSGAVEVHTETFALDDAPLLYERMHAGTLNGRGVVVP